MNVMEMLRLDGKVGFVTGGARTLGYDMAEAMAEAGAVRIYADTSSADRYAGTRDFYQRMGFREGAWLPDFYAPGDGKIVFVKTAKPEFPPLR